MILGSFSERLAYAMEHAGYTQGALAKAVGMAQSSINQLLTKASGSRKTVEIANVLGVRAEWLATGVSPMVATTSEDISSVRFVDVQQKDSFTINVMDVEYSCGPGSYNRDFPDIVRSISIEPGYASRVFGGRDASSIKAINAQGDSMEGTIDPEDLVFIDITVKRFEGDGIYAFTYCDTSHIKRLQKVKDHLEVLSDNPAYRTWTIDASEESQLFIDGKVIVTWPMRLRRFS
ncbi:helix-turn-helix transcriptional regulator [Salmonella enterica]|uniref:Helix-turn-helix transcriptional regulator n=1 Tax=Salmonella enterica TaxID=28901 RepID=A0A759WAL4_SALER|nr:helix-turn-helix transcriptional regulator [Salmonella enterica]HAF1610922.1 helix-turn-helix transcriptional regulator [Salmonella enterica]HAG2208843.1 helix-turn-helix transcriptional regulator [Salmonella enterica]